MVLIGVPSFSVAQSADAPTGFDLDENPDTLTVFGLNTIDVRGPDRTFIITEVYRTPEKRAVMATWHINCPRRTMNMIKIMAISALKGADQPDVVKGPTIPVSRTVVTHDAYTLACLGAANLPRDKLFFDDPALIIRNFWR